MGTSNKIPVVDMGQLAVGREESAISEEEWKRVSEEVMRSLPRGMPVCLSNHGIDIEQIEKSFEVSAALFNLPLETKEIYTKDINIGHGYISINREKVAQSKWQTEIREAYDVKSLEARNPKEVPSLIPTLAPFTAACKTLSSRLLAAIALGLGLQRDFFVDSHQEILSGTFSNSSVLRLLHYPPLSAAMPEDSIRCGEHTDYGTVTLLFQDSIGGLQVRNADGQWVDAEPIPGAILFFAGDLLQLWAAKKVLATEHRVVIPMEKVRQMASRYSITLFVHPDDEVIVKPIDGSTDPPPIRARQHILNMFAKTYDISS